MLHRWDNVTYKSYLQGQLLFFFSASVVGGVDLLHSSFTERDDEIIIEMELNCCYSMLSFVSALLFIYYY